MSACVLFADDDAGIRLVVSTYLSRAGYEVRATDNPETLMKWVGAGIGDVVLTDVHMDGTEIFDFIPKIKAERPDMPILIISANTQMGTAMKSGRSGVFDYIPKPFDLEKLAGTVKRAVESKKAKSVRQHAKGVAGKSGQASAPILGRSAAMQPVFRAIADYADSDLPLFVHGPAGSGKSLVARCVHEASTRASAPCILFRDGRKPHDMDELRGVTLLVDRLPELSGQAQTRLLELMEENVERPAPERFRLIVMSAVPLVALRETDTIRPDLFSWLTGAHISLPSLKDRGKDVLDLADHFMAECASDKRPRLHKSAQDRLLAYDWPGNVRELKNLIHALSVRFEGSAISADMIGTFLVSTEAGVQISDPFSDIRVACRKVLLGEWQDGNDENSAYEQALSWIEKPLLEEALRLCGGNNSRAAKMLGIHRNTLRTRLKKLFG